MPDLKIPYASLSPFLSTMVHANNADKANSYYCPCCSTRLILRNGDIRVKHFSHPAGSCSAESIYHKTAKSLILDIFREGRFYDIKFPAVCDNCHSQPTVSFPESITNMVLEYRLDGYIYDIVCFSGSSAIFAIEVLYSHKVDSLKSLFSPIPIFEIRALDILDNPYHLLSPPILHKDSWSRFLGPVNLRSCCIDYAIREADRLAAIRHEQELWKSRLASAAHLRKIHDRINQRVFYQQEVRVLEDVEQSEILLQGDSMLRSLRDLEKLRLRSVSRVSPHRLDKFRSATVEDLERRGLW